MTYPFDWRTTSVASETELLELVAVRSAFFSDAPASATRPPSWPGMVPTL